jgi:murein DD-endopeptidase MepM/ murein hydrolase activator NlpD
VRSVRRLTRFRSPRHGLSSVLALALVVGAVGTGLASRDGDEPRLYLEVPGRVAAGAPFDVFLSSSVPATITVQYGEEIVEAVEQDLRVSFLGLPGSATLEAEVVDGDGRSARTSSVVAGVLPPVPAIDAPPSVTVGDPLTVRVAWEPAAVGPPGAFGPAGVAPARIADAWVELDGRVLDARAFDGGLLALAAVPLADAPGKRRLRAVVVDEFGTWHRVEAPLEVRPNPHPVQQLVIPASILAVSTDDGRRIEAEALAEAFAAVPPEQRWSRPFMLPIVGRGTSGFGLPRRYGPGGNVSYHLGADIAAPEGTPIHATNEGVVRVAGQYPIKGGLVILDHGFGVTSLYFHQSRIAVEAGDVVERGDVIGFVGSTGLSTGPHLHWEMRVDGVPTDPLAWVDRHYPVPIASSR